MPHYSEVHQNILEEADRKRVGRQLLAISKDYLRGQLKHAKVLDVGCAGGTITALFAGKVGQIIGIDPDKPAIDYARQHYPRKNLRFEVADATKLPWGSSRFELVVCNQVYECLPNDEKLMSEIYRVLKPGGVCLFGARNRWALMEPQVGVPFLSMFPPKVANVILKIIRPGKFYFGKYRGYFSLRQLCRKFNIVDYTPKILANPEKFGFTKLTNMKLATKVGAILYPLIAPLVPNYLWVLRKPR